MPESERRQVTILFADISGFTSMSEKMDPENVTALMNECFGFLGKVVEDHGGMIDKFIGDCVMALFGVPRALEDAPLRAVSAAIEMRRLLREWRGTQGLADSVDLHIGINSGEAISGVVGSEGKREFTVMGDAVNLASRLKDAAGHGQIYVGPLTWRHTQDAFDYRELEPITLKGKEKPVLAYEVRARKARDSDARMATADRAVFSGLVGREKELDRLELHALKVINGEGSIVFVIGEAGVGKSRLVAELRNKECMKRVTLLEGSAQSIGRNLSFHPFREMLDSWAGIRDEDDEDAVGSKLERAIEIAAPGDAKEIFPFLATMRGLSLTGTHAERMREIEGDAHAKLIAKSLRDLVSAFSLKRPVVVLLEDLHWADQSSLELLEALFRLVEKERVFFLVAMRPNESKTDSLVHAAREMHGAHSEAIFLSPLGRIDTEQMISNLLRTSSLPTNVLESIVERAGGNPFFIEEIIRSWIDEGAVKASGDGFQITDRIAHAAIPYTINQAIMSRIDRLEDGTRDILRVASVIGRSFFHRILAQVAENAGSVSERIERLKEIQLILERSRMEEVEFLFKHALVQQSIYDSLLIQVRKKLHLSVARAIETLFEKRIPEFYGVLAFHSIQAEDLERAEKYLLKAGDSMLASSASSEAIYYYQEGLKLYLQKLGQKADPLKLSGFEKSIAYAWINKGQYREAAEHFEKALTYLGVRPEKGIALLLGAAGGFLRMVRMIYLPQRRSLPLPGEREREIIEFRIRKAGCMNTVDQINFVLSMLSALRYFSRFDIRQVYSLTVVLSMMSSIASIMGFLKFGRKLLEKAETEFREHSYLSEIVYMEACLQLGCFDGTWDAPQLLELRERGQYKGEYQVLTANLAWCGLICIEKADWPLVEERIDQLWYLSDVFENIDALVCHHEVKGKYLLKLGKAAEAREQIDKGFIAAEKGGQKEMLIYFLGMKAAAQLALGDRGGSEQSLHEARDLVKKEGLVMPHFLTRFAMARFAFEMSLFQDHGGGAFARRASRAGKKALSCSKKWIGDRTESLRLMGTLSWLRGRHMKALVYWRESISVAEHIGARLELARTWMEVGRRLGEKRAAVRILDELDARSYLSKAEAFFGEKDLARDLETLKGIESA
jgi:class 3 adenylate cyclase/tetratricopeptide (TPR) repeat protein